MATMLSFEYNFENCPGFDELVQFRRDDLSVELAEGIERHLNWCPRCQKVEAMMIVPAESSSQEQQTG